MKSPHPGRSSKKGAVATAQASTGEPSLTRAALLVGLATFLLYLPTLWSGFVYDAQSQIKNDRYIHTPAHLVDVLTFRVLSQDVLDQNRPVQLLSLMLDSLVWGENPFGYHLTSNLLHAANAALLFTLLVRLLALERAPPSGGKLVFLGILGALFFAFQPTLTEAIAEVSSREDSLATFFILLGLVMATRFPGTGGRQAFLRGTGIVLAFLFAAGTKETGYAGPGLLGLYWLLYRRKEPISVWGPLLAIVGLAVAGFICARFGLQPEHSKIFVQNPAPLGGSLKETLKIQPQLWARLWWNIICPTSLSADYVPQNVYWITRPYAIATLVLVLSVQALLSFKSRLALLGTAIFWLGILPVSNFIPIYRVLADRFLYLPLAGFVLILCAGLALIRPQKIFAGISALIVVGIILFTPLSWNRQLVFADSLSLWTDTVTVSPQSDTAHDNLAYALYEKGQYQKALDHFREAVSLTRGKSPDAWAGAALTLEKLGNPEKAEEAYRQAISLNGDYRQPWNIVETLIVDRHHANELEIIAKRVRNSPAP